MDKIFNLLESQIINTNKSKSSSYNIYLKNINYKNIYAQFSTGGFAKKTIIRDIFNFFFSRLVYKFEIFKTESYKRICLINRKLNVSLNVNMILHLFIFKFLKEKISPKNLCILGDGKANAVFNAFTNFPNVKIFSINISEVLINDYLIIKKSKIFNTKEIDVVTKITQHISPNKKLILIPSHMKNFINRINVDLFISIECLQELNEIEKKRYLKIISRQKNNFFYFKERNKKILPGGEKNLFKEFFPKNCNILMNKEVTFQKIFYNTKFPYIHFINKSDGVKHAFVQIK